MNKKKKKMVIIQNLELWFQAIVVMMTKKDHCPNTYGPDCSIKTGPGCHDGKKCDYLNCESFHSWKRFCIKSPECFSCSLCKCLFKFLLHKLNLFKASVCSY